MYFFIRNCSFFAKIVITKEIPIIAMTANAFQDDIRECIDAGMNAHIAKPIDSKKIEDTLKAI